MAHRSRFCAYGQPSMSAHTTKHGSNNDGIHAAKLQDLSHFWYLVSNGTLKQAAGALQILDASRTTLGQLTTDQALVLLDCLHRVKGEQAESQSVAACFYLLARWCRNNHTEIDTDVDSTMCLTDGVRTGLAIAGNPDKTPEMSCAICLFLSSAAAARKESRSSCVSSICTAMLTEADLLTRSSRLEEFLGSLGQLAALLEVQVYMYQDEDTAVWIAALVLQLWEPLNPSNAAEIASDVSAAKHFVVVAQMSALQSSYLALARSHIQRGPLYAWKSLFHRLCKLLLSVDVRFMAPAVLISAGLLEGSQTLFLEARKEELDLHTLPLSRMLEAACRRACHKQGVSSLQGWTLQQTAAVASAHLHLACCLPWPPPANVVKCVVHALLATAFTLQELFQAASNGTPTALVNALLRSRSDSVTTHSAPMLVRLLVRDYATCSPEIQVELQELLFAANSDLYIQYSAYITNTPSPWIQSIDRGIVQQILRNAFLYSIDLFTEVWEVSEATSRHKLSVKLLDQLSLMQFCRVRAMAYPSLLERILTVAASSIQACREVLQSMPTFAALVAPEGCPGQQQQPRWSSNPIVASEMQFRMSILGSCVPKLPEDVIVAGVLPVVHLFLGHPLKSVVSSAHTLFCTVLQGLKEKEQLAPFYIKRALACYPDSTPLPSLMMGVDALARNLSSDSPGILFCFGHILERARELRAASASQSRTVLEAQKGLLHLLAHLTLVMDLQALELITSFIEDCPAECRSHLHEDIERVLTRSNDYTRKVILVRWHQRVSASMQKLQAQPDCSSGQ